VGWLLNIVCYLKEVMAQVPSESIRALSVTSISDMLSGKIFLILDI